MGLGQIDELLVEAGFGGARTGGRVSDDEPNEPPRLALVGTPCVIQGAAALERYEHDAADPIALTVALMCTRTFEHGRLVSRLVDLGIEPGAVDRLDVTDGTLHAHGHDGEALLEAPVEAFESAGLRGCDECADFVGAAADISVGSVGSPEGRTTVVVRTPRGEAAWERAHPALGVSHLERTDAIDRLDAWNTRRAREALAREYDPEGPVGIGQGEHRAAYDGTDREPRPLNPARVHQYEEWC